MDGLLLSLAGAVFALALVWMRRRFADFGAQKPEDYKGTGPDIDIRTHLKGPILCEGVIYGPFGRVSSRFVADMKGSWDGNTGTLTETFRYDNGETQDRAWNLTVGDDGVIRSTAEDLVGTGEGRQVGSGVEMRYRIRLPESSGGHVLDSVDWMYLLDNGTIVNRSQFRKCGIKVAEIVATMRPQGDA